MVTHGSQIPYKDRVKILSHGGKMMMVEVQLTKRTEFPSPHQHPHEQTSYLLNGRLRIRLGNDTHTMQKGDSVYIASNVPHCVQALEDDTVILDVFTPIREDFLIS